MSTFVQQRTWEIFRNASTEPLSSPPLADNDEIQHEHSLQTLRSTLEGLNAPPDDEQLLQSLEVLNDSNVSNVVIGENSYMNGISERVLAGIYARAMDSLLQQALDSDKEARFWWDVERSWWNASRFLVQSRLHSRHHTLLLIT
jgi:nuclear-control-of-ATPase protein 2